MIMFMYRETSKPQALPSKRNGCARSEVAAPGGVEAAVLAGIALDHGP
jgi:hypothetical protein